VSCVNPCIEFKPRVTFTLDEVMDALDEAFAHLGGRSSAGCALECKLREILSARSDHVGSESTPTCEEERLIHQP